MKSKQKVPGSNEPIPMTDLSSSAVFSGETRPSRSTGKARQALAVALLGTTLVTGFAVQGASKPVSGAATANAEAMPAMAEQYKMRQIVDDFADTIAAMYTDAETKGGAKTAIQSQNLSGKITSYGYGYTHTAPVQAATAEAVHITDGEGEYELSVSFAPRTDPDGVLSTPVVGVDIRTGVQNAGNYSQTYSLHIGSDENHLDEWTVDAWSGSNSNANNPAWSVSFNLGMGPGDFGATPNTVYSVDELAPYLAQAQEVMQSAGRGDAVGYLTDPTK